MMTARLCLVAVVGALSAALHAAAPDSSYRAPRNAFGQPDLEGVWNFSSEVPLERPKAFADKKFFTREELDKHVRQREAELDSIARIAPVEFIDRLWLDYRPLVENLRTSLIIYPENGRMPALLEGVQRIGGLMALFSQIKGTRPVRFLFGGIGLDGPEDRGLSERCIAADNSVAPIVPSFDNNYVQIFQSPSHVALLLDTVHGARIARLDTQRHLDDRLRSWAGDARAHWEGATLVIETRNFNGRTQSFNDSGTSRDKVVTERIRRVGADVLEYEATIIDATTFQDKIVIAFPMARTNIPIFESACHESNYSMSLMLANARKEEQTRPVPR